jgi:hypothetical protein
LPGLGGNQHGRQTSFWLDTLAGSLADVSRFLRSANLAQTADRPLTRTFQSNARRTKLGLQDGGTFSLAGEWRRSALVDVHGRTTRILFNRYSIAADLRSTVMRRNIEIPVVSTYPDGGVNFVRRPVLGSQDGSLNFTGLFNAAAGRVHEVFSAAKSSATAAIVSVAGEGFVPGNLVDMGKFQLTNYNISAGTEAPTEVSADLASDDQQDTGVALNDDLIAVTALGVTNGTSVDETAATASGWVAHLHVKAYSGWTNATVKIQDSADGSAWADLAGATFNAVTGVAEQRFEGASAAAVRQFVRAVVTTTGTSGSISFAVAFARRGYVSATAATHRHLAGLLGRALTSSFEYGPEGGTTGALKLSGEARLASLEITFPVDGDVEFSAELVVDGALSEGVFA